MDTCVQRIGASLSIWGLSLHTCCGNAAGLCPRPARCPPLVASCATPRRTHQLHHRGRSSLPNVHRPCFHQRAHPRRHHVTTSTTSPGPPCASPMLAWSHTVISGLAQRSSFTVANNAWRRSQPMPTTKPRNTSFPSTWSCSAWANSPRHGATSISPCPCSSQCCSIYSGPG